MDQINNTISGDYFIELAKSISDSVILVDPTNFTLQYVNKIATGYNEKDLIGSSVFNFISPEYVENYRNTLNELVKTSQPRSIQLEIKSISDTSGKSWVHCNLSAINDANNSIESILILVKNITREKYFERELQNKQEKLSAIINNSKDIILSIDKNYNLTEFNSVFGAMVERAYSKTNLNGSLILNYIDPTKHEHLKEIYSRVFNGEAVVDVEKFQTVTEESIYFESNYNPIKNYNQEIIGISIFSKNISERVLNEQKLKNTLKEKEVLLAEIHHRIKNNLAMVSSMLQLKEMNVENCEAKEALSSSRKRIKSTALIHEMLYRIDTLDKISIKDYLAELFKILNENKSIKLVISGDEYILDLNLSLPFGLLMHELMMNSLKHSLISEKELKLSIESKLNQDKLIINYHDCSGEFPADLDFYNTSSTGLMLIHTFIDQLSASIILTDKKPPKYIIEIPITT